MRKGAVAFNPRTFLATIGSGRTIAEYRENEIVFSQGDSADAVFYIESGKIKLAVVSEQGKEAIVGVLARGDFFGEGCLAGQPLCVATASAMVDCLIVRLEKGLMMRMLRDEPKVSAKFISYLLSRNIRIHEDLAGC